MRRDICNDLHKQSLRGVFFTTKQSRKLLVSPHLSGLLRSARNDNV